VLLGSESTWLNQPGSIGRQAPLIQDASQPLDQIPIAPVLRLGHAANHVQHRETLLAIGHSCAAQEELEVLDLFQTVAPGGLKQFDQHRPFPL
jgi:hypothetical protein